MEAKEFASSRHKRSKSEINKNWKGDLLESPSSSCNVKADMEKKVPEANIQDQLKQEIMQLEKRLKDQMAVRLRLEKALGYRKTVISSSNESCMPKPAKELLREIAVLELEVMHLEQYLLSLYRKAFDQQTPIISSNPSKVRSKPMNCQRKLFNELPGPQISSIAAHPFVHSARILPSQISTSKLEDETCHEHIDDERNVHRCHSSLNHRTVYSSRISPSEAALARALQDCHSQPLSFLTDWHDSKCGMISLSEYLGACTTDYVADTPNKISEDMVRCMGAMYIKLSDPLLNPGQASSPTSSFSSMSAISPQCIGDMWSPGLRYDSILDSRLVNPFCIEGLKEFSGPYNAMVEISSIRTEDLQLKVVEDLLHTYKSLVSKLSAVNVRRMKNDEKLPFWLNLHNALVMHAYLVHGVPQGSVKRTSQLNKASCIVGGHSVNAYMIQNSFLGCHTHYSGQWFKTFMFPVLNLKTRTDWKRLYAIEKHEPLLHFALCSGNHSDPAVRIYTAKKWYQQLETAKEEYIRATVGIQKEQKIFLPMLIEAYAKDSCMNSQMVVDMIKSYLPETMCIAIKRCQRGRSHKIIEWLPHKFNFRYLFSKEVANQQLI